DSGVPRSRNAGGTTRMPVTQRVTHAVTELVTRPVTRPVLRLRLRLRLLSPSLGTGNRVIRRSRTSRRREFSHGTRKHGSPRHDPPVAGQTRAAIVGAGGLRRLGRSDRGAEMRVRPFAHSV